MKENKNQAKLFLIFSFSSISSNTTKMSKLNYSFIDLNQNGTEKLLYITDNVYVAYNELENKL